MTEKILNSSALMFIESDVLELINIEEIVIDFSDEKKGEKNC